MRTLRAFLDNWAAFAAVYAIGGFLFLTARRWPRAFRAIGVASTAACIVVMAIIAIRWAHAVRVSWLPPYDWDDAYIFLRYVKNVLLGRGLVWNPGERVEGYSSPLYMALLLAAGRLAPDPAYVPGVLNPVLFVLLLWMAERFSRSLRGASFFSPPLNTGLILAGPLLLRLPVFGGYGLIFDGMESVVVAVCLLGTAWAYGGFARGETARATLGLVFWLGLLSLARPEGFILSVALMGFALSLPWGTRSSARWLLLLHLATLGAQVFWRYTYYGDWVPNTFYAKAYHMDRLALLARGVRWGLSWCLGIAFCYLVWAPLAVLRGRRGADRAGGPGVPTLNIVLFTAAAGAGFATLMVVNSSNSLPRLLPCVIPPVAVLLDFVWHHTAAPAWWERRILLRHASAVCLLLSVLPALGALGPSMPPGSPRLNPYMGTALGLKAFVKQGETLAVNAVGVVSYVLINNPVIDEFGLNDRDIARSPTSRRVDGVPGHETFNWDSVLARAPEYILTRSPVGVTRFDASFPDHDELYTYKDLFARPEFSEKYALLTEFSFPDWSTKTKTQVWVRRDLYPEKRALLGQTASD